MFAEDEPTRPEARETTPACSRDAMLALYL